MRSSRTTVTAGLAPAGSHCFTGSIRLPGRLAWVFPRCLGDSRWPPRLTPVSWTRHQEKGDLP
jgi:hypothetical protein